MMLQGFRGAQRSEQRKVEHLDPTTAGGYDSPASKLTKASRQLYTAQAQQAGKLLLRQINAGF